MAAQDQATGSVGDMVTRLRATLPLGWFPQDAPVLAGVLSGLGAGWSWVYGLLEDARAQTRVATARDDFLDMTALDYFGGRISRRPRQSDEAFRRRIRTELLRPRGTRQAIVDVLTDLTGRAPAVFEPGRTADTGGWNMGAGYGAGGGWGSLALPYQCFVTAYRPPGAGIASVAGYGAGGGYGVGAIEYASLAMVDGAVTDADIHAAIADTLPVATIAWTRISN